jgi:hypothetical protein
MSPAMTDPYHLLLRSARPDDLDALERFAAASAIGISASTSGASKNKPAWANPIPAPPWSMGSSTRPSSNCCLKTRLIETPCMSTTVLDFDAA